MATKTTNTDNQIDINKVVESLSNMIAQQAVRIAMLEATLTGIKAVKDTNE
jgi:hypothetical protein